MMNDTIFALSSGSLPSGVAVIRVSGPQATAIADEICAPLPKPRQVELRSIRTRNKEVIDQGLVVLFMAPASFTGEDCLELQVHGGRAVVQKLLEELATFPATRPAEAGEFTRRAFENGKIDLVEAEGLADLISAETEMQRRLAAEQARGGLSALYHDWARRLTHARAMIEAELDFADEDDIPGSVAERIWGDMTRLQAEMAGHLAQAKTGEIIRDGLKVALVGSPNAGKSSLLNALAKRDVAIVTDIPGTTRDVISVDLDIGGFAVRLIDTAGLRETSDIVEREGVRRARAAAEEADLVLWLRDATDAGEDLEVAPGKTVIRVATKADLGGEPCFDFDLRLSVVTGEGVNALMDMIANHLAKLSTNSLAIPSRIRHVNYLSEAVLHLDAANSYEALELDLRAEHLRLSAQSLGRITGSVDVEALLDVIFSEFCIGK